IFVEGREARAESRGRVSLHDDPVRPLVFDDGARARDELRRQTGQRLVRCHEVEVVVWHELEEVQDRGQHLAVLSSDAEARIDPAPSTQRADDGAELDRLGTRSDHDEHTRCPACHAVSWRTGSTSARTVTGRRSEMSSSHASSNCAVRVSQSNAARLGMAVRSFSARTIAAPKASGYGAARYTFEK